MTVDDGEEKEIVLAENGFDTADDGGAVGVANFFGDHAHGESALDAEGARQEIRAIVELAGRFEDAVAGVFGDTA